MSESISSIGGNAFSRIDIFAGDIDTATSKTILNRFIDGTAIAAAVLHRQIDMSSRDLMSAMAVRIGDSYPHHAISSRSQFIWGSDLARLLIEQTASVDSINPDKVHQELSRMANTDPAILRFEQQLKGVSLRKQRPNLHETLITLMNRLDAVTNPQDFDAGAGMYYCTAANYGIFEPET